MQRAETLAARLERRWWGRESPSWPWRLAARLYGAISALRTSAYRHGWLRSHRVGRPVIIVGNLTVGGSGKTPFVLWLCAQLSAAGYRPGIVLRGYGSRAGRSARPTLVAPDSAVADVGDEALVLRAHHPGPVVAGADRVAAARVAVEQGATVIVSDDGLQHLALAREAEIIVVGEREFGNGALLPAGPLREPPERLARVDAVVWRRAPRASGQALSLAMRLAGGRLRSLDGRSEAPLARYAGRRVHAVAGIGDPAAFFASLRAAGLEPVPHVFDDHHRYRAEDLAFDEALPVVMTEKDAVKCRAWAGAERWYLPVEAQLEADSAAALLQRLAARIGPPG